MAKIFVFLNKDIVIQNIKLEKNLVGILVEDLKDYSLVSFTCCDMPLKIIKSAMKTFNPNETGDSYPKKVCNVCCKLLDTSLFSKNQNGKNNRSIRRPSCDDCRKIIDGVSMTNQEKKKWSPLKPQLEIFECPICKKKTIPRLTSKVVLDHNHTNGKARGWICDSCNTGIGRFKDDVSLLKSAIEFINKN